MPPWAAMGVVLPRESPDRVGVSPAAPGCGAQSGADSAGGSVSPPWDRGGGGRVSPAEGEMLSAAAPPACRAKSLWVASRRVGVRCSRKGLSRVLPCQINSQKYLKRSHKASLGSGSLQGAGGKCGKPG